MIDAKVRSAFFDLVDEFQTESGFQMPDSLRDYLIDLLAVRLRDIDIIPQPSFAERYLEIHQRPTAVTLQQFGDQCLFFVSLMPGYGTKRGLNLDYYCTLGISSYYSWGDLARDSRGAQLGNWFYYLQNFLQALLHHRPVCMVKI